MKKIALVSPSENAYSETFIKQHRDYLNGNIIYYFGGSLPKKNNVEGTLATRKLVWNYRIKNKIIKQKFSLNEVAFIKSLKKNNIDIVIAEYGTTAARVMGTCKYLNIPLIAFFHGFDASVKDVLQHQAENYKQLFEISEKIFVVSQKMRTDIIALGCDSSKVVVNACCPDDYFFDITPKFKSQQFLAVGRFTDKKAPYYTILAFKEVLKQYPKATLKIGGNGVLFNMCKNLVRHYDLENNIEFLGVMTRQQIQLEMENSIAFVQHSIIAENGDSEGTPVVVLEASASGIPVVSTKHAGIPDVVLDKETGFLVDEHDVKGMANKMKMLLSDVKLSQVLGSKGKEFIRANYSLKQHISKIDEIVENVLRQ